MSTLLRVDASFRTEGSVTRAVADSTEQAWLAANPGGTVVRRDLGTEPLPSEAWGLAVGANWTPEEARTDEQRTAQALATTLGDEILAADAVILASPLYNFGVSQGAKLWIDLLIADPRLGPGTELLKGKPVVLITAQGGSYQEGAPRFGWDHGTPYLQRILGDNFLMAVDTIVAEFTLAGSNPAMADFVGIAEQSLASAHEQAAGHGTSLKDRLAAAV